MNNTTQKMVHLLGPVGAAYSVKHRDTRDEVPETIVSGTLNADGRASFKLSPGYYVAISPSHKNNFVILQTDEVVQVTLNPEM
jgi:hypothetical protein